MANNIAAAAIGLGRIAAPALRSILLIAGSTGLAAGRLLGQHEHAAMQHADSMVPGPLGIPHTRMGSGSAWLPDASAMRAYHWMPGRWTLMLHGDADLVYTRQFSDRGAQMVFGTNWLMFMAMRPLQGGNALLHLHAMGSAEPLTVGGRGYPLLLQSGETWQGRPLHDRQHPHDLFVELAAIYEQRVMSGLGVALYAAPVGEPALGPVAFMHRPPAQSDPIASIAHHWQDATHITFGVLTGGVFTRHAKLEASWFNGREPDENRYDLDLRRPERPAHRESSIPLERQRQLRIFPESRGRPSRGAGTALRGVGPVRPSPVPPGRMVLGADLGGELARANHSQRGSGVQSPARPSQ